MSYTAIIEKCEEGGYFAQCAEIENAFTQGETIKEVMENLKDVISLVLSCEKDIQIKQAKRRGIKFLTRRIAVL